MIYITLQIKLHQFEEKFRKEAPLHASTESPYTQLDKVLHFLFSISFFSIIFIPPTLLNIPLHFDFDPSLSHGSLVAQRGDKSKAGGSDVAGIL